MTLSVSIRHQLGALLLEARFESRGRLTALFGPSGSGKSTLINLIAGLIRPQRARIAINGQVLADTERGVLVPPYRRRIGYVFQDARLFPHLTVARNLRYGRYFTPAPERYGDPDGVIGLLGLSALLDRYPATLSGGEKQRVAIGRALLASPRLILMDEPLASLDEARKAEILPYIERLRDELAIPIVYVSHAVAEVARLATDVVVLRDGRTIASGAASEILSRQDLLPDAERDEAGALIDVEVVGREPHGLAVLRSSGGSWRVTGLEAPAGTRLRARIRARDVMLAVEKPSGISALNVLPGTVSALSAETGPEVFVTLACGNDALLARITRASAEGLGLAVGRSVYMIVKSVSFASGDRLHARPRAVAP